MWLLAHGFLWSVSPPGLQTPACSPLHARSWLDKSKAFISGHLTQTVDNYHPHSWVWEPWLGGLRVLAKGTILSRADAVLDLKISPTLRTRLSSSYISWLTSFTAGGAPASFPVCSCVGCLCGSEFLREHPSLSGSPWYPECVPEPHRVGRLRQQNE